MGNGFFKTYQNQPSHQRIGKPLGGQGSYRFLSDCVVESTEICLIGTAEIGRREMLNQY
jgi:hypothetical protein